MSEFDDAVGWLRSLGASRIEPGHERIRALLRLLGEPHTRLRGALVVGTNGKGSTAEYARSVLTAAGHRVGSMPSPHVGDETERIQIDGRPIASTSFVALACRVRSAVEDLAARDVRPTMFEALVAMAYLWFDESRVDLVVAEAGMGGRDDATSVAPFAVTAVTTVALDHTAFLGADVAQIAANKAGAIRRGGVVVIGDLPVEARREVVTRVRDVGATGIWALRDLVRVRTGTGGGIDLDVGRLPDGAPPRTVTGLKLSSPGTHQQHNLGVAYLLVSALESALGLQQVPERCWRAGVAATRLPARLEEIDVRTANAQRRLIVDGAHNPAALGVVLPVLRHMVSGCAGPVRVIFGAMRDKDCRAMVAQLPSEWEVVFTSSGEVRSADPSDLAALRGGRSCAVGDVRAALDVALGSAGTAPVLVLGSLHVAGLVRDAVRARSAAGSTGSPSVGEWGDLP